MVRISALVSLTLLAATAGATTTLAVKVTATLPALTTTTISLTAAPAAPPAATEAQRRLQMETKARREREIERDRAVIYQKDKQAEALRLEKNLRDRMELDHSTPRGTTTGPALPPSPH